VAVTSLRIHSYQFDIDLRPSFDKTRVLPTYDMRQHATPTLKEFFTSLIILKLIMEKSEEAAQVETSVEPEIRDVSMKKIGDDARLATEIEHQMTFMQAIKIYPKAMAWSVFFSLGVIMTGFDPQLLGSLYAEPAFQRDFGYKFGDSYIISAPWQTALGMGNPLGQVLGALGAGYPMEWYGRKWVCFHWTN
jgi:hypothetical protein